MLKKILFVVFACVSIIGVTSGANALTVSYDCGTSNGTAPTDSTNYNSGDVVTVKPNSCDVPSEKHFAGYVCGSTNVAAGNTFTISSNTTCTAQYENGKFAVKTTSTTTVLNFSMTAVGTFTVDCGDGGTLSSSANPTDVSGDTITRTITTETIYTCTWANAGAHTVKFNGTGTGYDTDGSGVLTFYAGNNDTDEANNSQKIASVSGNLYLLLPPTGTANGQIPRFSQTFYNATNLTSIPSTLFNGYTTASDFMFESTFSGCTGLTSIPHDLFATFTTGASYMFTNTFYGCTGLTAIPHDLFATFTTGARAMFQDTFSYCTGLTSIPHDLFATFTTGAYGMFSGTFSDCTGLTSIPHDLFSSLGNTGADGMFMSTFSRCTGLTSIPSDLFANFTTGGSNTFHSTFAECTGLTSLPDGLFANITNITTGSVYTFAYTFTNSTNLSGYIPHTMFAGLIANNADPSYGAVFKRTFTDTNMATSCDNYPNTFEYASQYKEAWGGKVSCAPGCVAGQYSPVGSTSCSTCTAGNFCLGGVFTFDASVNQGITACSSVGDNSYTTSDAGATADTQCYKTCSTTAIASGKNYYGKNACSATTCNNGYHFESGAPDLNTTIGTIEAVRDGYVDGAGNLDGYASTYGLTANDTNAFVVDYGNAGIVRGHGLCSTQSGDNNSYTWSNPTIVNNLTDETGQNGAEYCYCQLNSYTPYNGTSQSFVAPWIYLVGGQDISPCSSQCASNCGFVLGSNADQMLLAFRSALFGTLDSIPSACDANTINITWHGATSAAIAANNAGTAIYGGDIRTPQSYDPSQVPAGKRFVGWKFRKTPQNNG